MQYGSIGWSVGACLGCAVGSKPKGKRVLLFVGDGCFQIGAQVPLRASDTNPLISGLSRQKSPIKLILPKPS